MMRLLALSVDLKLEIQCDLSVEHAMASSVRLHPRAHPIPTDLDL
jgi:hypothetical protein